MFTLFAVILTVAAFIAGAATRRKGSWLDHGSPAYGRWLGQRWLKAGCTRLEAELRLEELHPEDPFRRAVLGVFLHEEYERACVEQTRRNAELREHAAVLWYYGGHLGD